jgi:hypothetical protein
MRCHATLVGALLVAVTVVTGETQQGGGAPPQIPGRKPPSGIVPIPLPIPGKPASPGPAGGTPMPPSRAGELPPDVQAALEQLNRVRRDRVVYFQAGLARAGFWLVAELDGAIARKTILPEDLTVSATVADAAGRSVATATGVVSANAPTCTIRFPAAPASPGEYSINLTVKSATRSLTDQLRVTVPQPDASLGSPLVLRSGPFTGPAFQATADPRFRKAERLRADAPLVGVADSVRARLLDRNGHPLRVPVTAAQRTDAGVSLATAEVALAPLAPGDYLLEVTARFGAREEKALAAFRIVP